jgi:hypothetical protein
MKPLSLIMTAAAGALLATAPAGVGPALAHHSFNMFALDKVVTMTGTVTDYRYQMPHVWIYMLTSAPTGEQQHWGFECHSPNLVARKGWKINTLKPGDKITVLMHPMKDGSEAGSAINVVLPNGQTLWNADSIDSP